ncbi:hypothetical protein PP175_25630 (plasmid) [Aneurinibacillus sp. Ricciae_BoGa-3]|uniref:hypothetical protein n=1 Tax=Aneurinibacillus sp. Ricciae_BoGa-3 TaxID=3022697 RepID=UPI0023424907|nr:hypothetical protein [Aneurinibacillus sp. Ricciae_BoGa-3]WCK57451.1 hypothetical protein PP175_25630 [Aneurinibacillus sp. Ricciae_BoGa-3]
MGEYLKHPNALEEEEIKYAVFRGMDFSNCSTWFSKKTLKELLALGYGNHYGTFKGNSDTLKKLIDNYEAYDTSYVQYEDFLVIEVPTEHVDRLKEFLLVENIGFVLYKEEQKLLVIDSRQLHRVEGYGKQLSIHIKAMPYEYVSERN